MNAPLDPSSFPLSLYHKAKQLFWDPQAIDLTQDARDWARLAARERDILLRLAAQFLGGQQAVTHDLTPLLIALRRQGGRLDDEMFLTTQLFESPSMLNGSTGGSSKSPAAPRRRRTARPIVLCSTRRCWPL
jgi:hypothetical protein